MNRLYEGMFVFDANQAGKDWPGLERHVQDLLQRHRGELVHAERWPDRKLAYEIKGCRKGTYYLTYFNAPTTAIQGLQRDCELSDRVLRAMFVFEEDLAEQCQKLKERDAARAAEAEAAAAAKAAAEESTSEESTGGRTFSEDDSTSAESADESAAKDEADDEAGDDAERVTESSSSESTDDGEETRKEST